MVSLFKFKKNKSINILILDVGSGSVGGAIVSFAHNKTAKILWSKRVLIPAQDKRGEGRLFISMSQTLEDLIAKAHKEYSPKNHGHIHKSVCFVSSPWHFSEGNVLLYQSKDSFTVDSKTLTKILEDNEKKISSTISKNLKDSGGGASIIDHNVFEVSLNGYPSKDFYNKKAKKVEISVLTSIASNEFISKVRKILDRYFHIEKTVFHPFIYPMHGFVEKNFMPQNDNVLIDITSEMTDVALVKNGAIVKTLSLKVGQSALVGEVSKVLSADHQMSKSLLKAFSENSLDSQTKSQIDEAIATVKAKWIEQFDLEFSANDFKIPASGSVFVSVDDSLASVMKDFLASSKTCANIKNIQIIKSEVVESFVALEPKGLKDVFLELEIGFEQEYVEKNLVNI